VEHNSTQSSVSILLAVYAAGLIAASPIVGWTAGICHVEHELIWRSLRDAEVKSSGRSHCVAGGHVYALLCEDRGAPHYRSSVPGDISGRRMDGGCVPVLYQADG
jgi:hypothetical protein